MRPFDNLESRPAKSAIVVENTESGTTMLVFPGLVCWWWSLLFCGLGILFIVYNWHGVTRLVQLDDNVTWLGKPLVVAVMMIFFGVSFLFGHHRVTLTREGISRDLSVFGMGFQRIRSQFSAIKEIACDKSPMTGPVIWIYRTQGDRFIIEGFCSVEERDWVAEELKNVWRNARATA